MMKKLLSLSLILTLSVGFFADCKKDKGNPPDLPPTESMTIDFSNFDSQRKSLEVFPGTKGTENSNFEFAATAAIFWKLIINTTLIIPVSAFKIAVNQTPVYLSAKNWQWSYSATVASVTYNARLTGTIGTSDIAWKMYLTKDPVFTDFVWFEGTSKLDGTGGQWILYESPAAQNTLLQIDWSRSGTSVGSIKYTYIKANAYNTSYIQYGLTTNALNAFYTIHYYNGAKFSDINIEWNTTTLNGRVKSPEYIDDNWYCWDSNKLNIGC